MFKLIFHLPEGKKQEFSFTNPTVIIGRGKDCDVVITEDGFSRQHAKVEFAAGETYVTDLESTNGVFIDGQKIEPGTRTKFMGYLGLQVGPAQVEVIETVSAFGPTPALKSKNLELAAVKVKKKKSFSQTGTVSPPVQKQPLPKAVYLLSGMFFVGVAVFFFSHRSETLSKNSETAEVKTLPPPTEKSFLGKDLLVSLVKDKSCAGEMAEWCNGFTLLEVEDEGALARGKSLLLYVNLTGPLAVKLSDAFQTLDVMKRMEVLLVRRVLISSLPTMLSAQSTFDNVQVVGGVVEGGALRPKIAVKLIRGVTGSSTDPLFYSGVFNPVLNEGKVEALEQLSTVYEKMIF